MFDIKRFVRSKHTYEQNASIQRRMRYKLVDMLRLYGKLEFESIFEFGAGNGEFTQLLCRHIRYQSYICNDINDYGLNPSLIPHMRYFVFDMAEIHSTPLWKMRFDLITSNACLQWLDFRQTIGQLRQILAPNGLCLLSTFGQANCQEVREITHYGLEYLSLEAMREILERYFEIIVLEEEKLCLQFSSPLEVFKHLKQTGVNALSHKAFLSKKMLECYQARFHNTLTYHPIYMLLVYKS